MGHMSLCMVRDTARKQKENLFDLAYRRSHHVPGDRLAFASTPHAFKHEREGRLLEEDGGYNNQVFATGNWHTSGKGIMLLTTDYVLILFYDPFPKEGELISDDEFMEEMAKMIRKKISRFRKDLGRDHEWVTKKTLVKKNPKAMDDLSAEVDPEADLTHVCALNYDMLTNDDDKELDVMKVLSDGYKSIRAMVQVEGLVAGMHGGSLNEFRSLDHWVSIQQDDVLVLGFNHLCIENVRKLKRTRRSTGDELLAMERELPGSPHPFMGLEDLVYLREFMNSQGYEVNL